MRAAIVTFAFLACLPTAGAEVLTGPKAFGDWREDAPGVQRLIRPGDLPMPYASRSASNGERTVSRPANAVPKAPPGFQVDLFAQGLEGPRSLRVAPNGDVFVAETQGGRIRVFRPGGAAPNRGEVFATGLDNVFGLALGPDAAQPAFVYAAVPTGVVRFAYRPGDMKSSGQGEWIIRNLPGGGHAMRDLAITHDGRSLLVSVGSLSNVAQGAGERPANVSAHEGSRAPGAAWGQEDGRAVLLIYDINGVNRRFFATGLRNCSGLAIQPQTALPWCVVNERDGLGDDLPPDYATSVRSGGFYGWPWYYIGANEDPRHKGARPDLRERVSVPDVLLQPHSAPLGIAFYDAAMFPADYEGDAFVTLHGSWNRAKRTGYKVVRLRFESGKATGVYEDFLTGFVVDDARVWGRPVGVAVMLDGALLVSEDSGGTIWRVSFTKSGAAR